MSATDRPVADAAAVVPVQSVPATLVPRAGGQAGSVSPAQSLPTPASATTTTMSVSNASRGGECDPEVGFPPSQVKGDFDDGLICLICRNVAENPTELICGHLFCYNHINTWFMRAQVTCPTCRMDVRREGSIKHGADIHLSYRRMMAALVLICPYKDQGCAKELSVDKYRRHVDRCEFAPATCRWPGCKYHEATGDADGMQARNVADHERDCEFRIVPCKMPGCEESMPRHELVAHQTQCGLVPATCTVRGCEASLTRGQVPQHLVDPVEMPTHMRLLAGEVSRLTALLDKPELVVDNTVVFRIPDIKAKFESVSFRFETRMYTLAEIGNVGYNFRVQLRKRRWPGERRRFNDKLGVYLHMEHGEADSILKWPFPYEYTFTILDQEREDPEHIQFRVFDGLTRGADWLGPGSGKGWGPQGMSSFDRLMSKSYTKGDCMFVKVEFHGR